MSSWGERMASVVTACGPRPVHHGLPYHRRLEKVRFGVPLEQVCKRDIPGPLLVMLLKLNKEGPFKKDVFRAPGHQGNMNKLIHFLQQGRLVNIHSFSVNTIASVMKQFLRKIPGGIFGRENEAILFTLFDLETEEKQLALAQRVFSSLPIYSQHLLVLLFGTFRVIHGNCESAKTGMTAEALGVSVAPSFFQTCVTEGKFAKPDEVQKFKIATRITTFFIDHFGMRDLFGRENYEYYARLTGRILRVEDEWIFFTYPPFAYMPGGGQGGGSAEALNKVARDDSGDEAEVESVQALVSEADVGPPSLEKSKTGSLEIIPENCPLDPNGRLSISLDDQNVSSPSPCESPGCIRSHHLRHVDFGCTSVDFRSRTIARTRLPPVAGSPPNENFSASLGRKASRGVDQKSYTCLPQVHQRQTERMKYRSEWFLSDAAGMVTVKCRPERPTSMGGVSASGKNHQPAIQPSPRAMAPLRSQPTYSSSQSSACLGRSLACDNKFTSASLSPNRPSIMNLRTPLPATPKSFSQDSSPTPQAPVHLRRRLSDKDKDRRLVRRSSSKRKDKENGGSSTSLEKHPTVEGPRDTLSTSERLPRSGSLKRADSAEAPCSPRTSSGHALLCRTGSQDTPHDLKPVESSESLGSESCLARSLPRI